MLGGKANGAVSLVQKWGEGLSGTNWKEGKIGEKGNLSICQESTHMAETPAPLLHAFLSLSTLPPCVCQIKFW